MEQKTHIMQMEANAKEKSPSVPLVRLVKDQMDMHLNKKEQLEQKKVQEDWSKPEIMQEFIENLKK